MSIEMNSTSIEGFEDVRRDLGALAEHSAMQQLRGLGGAALTSMPGGSDDRRWSQLDIPAGKAAGVLIEVWARATNAATLRSRLDTGIKNTLRGLGFAHGESSAATQTVNFQVTKSIVSRDVTFEETLTLVPTSISWVALFRSVVTSTAGSLQAGRKWAVAGLYQGGTENAQKVYAQGAPRPARTPHGAETCAVYRIVAQPTDGKFDLGRARSLNTAINSAVTTIANAVGGGDYGYNTSYQVQPVNPLGGTQSPILASAGGNWLLLLVAGAAVLASTGGKTAGAVKAAPFVAKGAAMAGKALFARGG